MESDKSQKKHMGTTDPVQAALKMLSQMEVSKKENTSLEEYKKSLLESELISSSTFEELKIPEAIIESLHLLGFKNPSIIQKQSIPEISMKQNVAFQSHSGSGKTIAFIIGALMCLDLEKKKTQVIIISPTRDLSAQIFGVLEKFKETVKFTSFLAHPDRVEDNTQITEQVVVGAPGTIKKILYRYIDPSCVKMVVLDEADALLGADGGMTTIAAIKKIPKKQIVMFSATFNEEMKKTIPAIAENVKTWYLEEKDVKPDNIMQFYMEVEEREKIKTLIQIYEMIPVGQSIIFVQTREKAAEVCKMLKEDCFDCELLHGTLEKEERDEVIKKFKNGEIKVLVTTNVLSRGLDVPQLNMAVNYDLPRLHTGGVDLETYIHRIGRTGRFSRAGVSITFIGGRRDPEEFMKIQKSLDYNIQFITIAALKTAISENVKRKTTEEQEGA